MTLPLCAEIAAERANSQRAYNVGGGPENAVSLGDLTAWCDSRFGRHAPEPDPRPITYDVPWVILDSSDADRDF